MESEEKGIDVGAMYDDAMEKAGMTDEPQQDDATQTPNVMTQVKPEPKQKPETKPEPTQEEVKAALESAGNDEPEEDVDGVLSSLLPAPKKPVEPEKKTVPLEALTEQRRKKQEAIERAKTAEKERDELQAQLNTLTDAESAGEKSPVEKYVEENPDDDFVPAKVQAEQLKWQREQDKKRNDARIKSEQAEQKVQEANQQLQQFDNLESQVREAVTKKVNQSEAEFKKTHPDFETVTKSVLAVSGLTQEERIVIFSSDNPAEQLYNRCLQKRTAMQSLLGIQPTAPNVNSPTNTDTTEDEDRELSDEELVQEVYGKK